MKIGYRKVFRYPVLMLFLFKIGCSYSQNYDIKSLRKECGGIYWESIDELDQKTAKLANFINIQNGDKIASIGTRSMTLEVALLVHKKRITFYCEDIDSTCTNKKQLSKVLNYYRQFGVKFKNINFKIVTGTVHETMLPNDFFDKILIMNSFHEFSDCAMMSLDIHSKLKKGGKLYIQEYVPQYFGQLHSGCEKPMFDEKKLREVLEKIGFNFVDSTVLTEQDGKAIDKIYCFKKTIRN